MLWQLGFGLLSMNRNSWTEVFVESTSYEIRELIPGSDYGVSIQSVLGSDSSHAANRVFSTRKQQIRTLQVKFRTFRKYLENIITSDLSASPSRIMQTSFR